MCRPQVCPSRGLEGSRCLEAEGPRGRRLVPLQLPMHVDAGQDTWAAVQLALQRAIRQRAVVVKGLGHGGGAQAHPRALRHHRLGEHEQVRPTDALAGRPDAPACAGRQQRAISGSARRRPSRQQQPIGSSNPSAAARAHVRVHNKRKRTRVQQWKARAREHTGGEGRRTTTRGAATRCHALD